MQTNAVENLSELLIKLRTLYGLTTEETFNTLQELVGEHISIRYEVLPGEPDETVYTTKFGRLNNQTVSRVLLTSNRKYADFSRKLTSQCNGIVLEYPSWNVLSMPPQMCNLNFKIGNISKNASSDYAIYEINDGTTVTLYWNKQDGKWSLSTTNGFDVSDYKWIGAKTYREAFDEVSKQYPKFSVDKLSKSRSYTIGFRHHDFHPLLTDPARMWLIQNCDLAVLNGNPASKDSDIGITPQLPITPPAWGKALTYHLCNTAKTALHDYMVSLRDGAPKIHYGYILRKADGADAADAADANIIIESSLLKQIRYHAYNIPKSNYDVPIDATTRLEYVILRAYLNCSTKSEFINLFPQFSLHYSKYDALFSKLIARVVTALRNKNTRESIFRSKIAKLDIVAAIMVGIVENAGKVNVMDSQGPSIIYDFVHDRANLDLYYTNFVLV